MAAVPRHVLTADYWRGYAGTKNVPPQEAARRLSWVETDSYGAIAIKPFGVKTLMYTNPNREQPGDPLFTPSEDAFAHTCSGSRVRGETHYAGQLLTNPWSRSLASAYKKSVADHEVGTHFDAIFADEAVGIAYSEESPCNFSFDNWLRGEAQLFRSLGRPIVYNALNDFHNNSVAPEIALNRAAIGGMMEECYAQLNPDHRVGGWQWTATEQTEIDMARDHKLFFCYGRDLTTADQAYDSRMYTYASFLLTYDPQTTVLWEYYKTPTGGHVMPESGLVAWNPVKRRVERPDQLRDQDGNYVRSYRDCYLEGRRVGPCTAVVNPDSNEHRLVLRGYNRTLALQGSGVFDGGTVRIQNAPPPGDLPALGAVIAFK